MELTNIGNTWNIMGKLIMKTVCNCVGVHFQRQVGDPPNYSQFKHVYEVWNAMENGHGDITTFLHPQ